MTSPSGQRPRLVSASDFRAAWGELEQAWPDTIHRARALPFDLLHESVNGEWSFIQTLRHLLFVTDAWGRRALSGIPAPFHDLDLPPTGMKIPALPDDAVARPSLDEVLELRGERVATVRSIVMGLSEKTLHETVRVRGPGYPRPGTYAVLRCARTLVREEWHHRRYAERDLAVLSTRVQ